LFQVCPDIEIIDETTLSDTVIRMTKRSDEIYNSNLQKSGNNANISSGAGCSGHHFNHQFSVLSQQHRRSDLITGVKLPIHGPRRFSKPAPISKSGFVPASNVLLFLSLRLRIITSFVNWLHLSTNGLYSIYIFICSVFFLVAPNEACRPSLVKSFSMIFVFKFFFSVRMLLISLEFDARSGLLAIH